MKNSGILIDRDGTLCAEVGYLDRVERLRLLPGSAKAIRQAVDAGFLAAVITNQSGVARGYFPEERVLQIHASLRQRLAAAGARLHGIYHCPHHPAAGCECRKPKPGMLLRAADDLELDLGRSYMIGDCLSDLDAGLRAGARPVLVLTGHGRRERERAHPPVRPAHVAADLRDAVRWILREASPRPGATPGRQPGAAP